MVPWCATPRGVRAGLAQTLVLGGVWAGAIILTISPQAVIKGSEEVLAGVFFSPPWCKRELRGPALSRWKPALLSTRCLLQKPEVATPCEAPALIPPCLHCTTPQTFPGLLHISGWGQREQQVIVPKPGQPLPCYTSPGAEKSSWRGVRSPTLLPARSKIHKHHREGGFRPCADSQSLGSHRAARLQGMSARQEIEAGGTPCKPQPQQSRTSTPDPSAGPVLGGVPTTPHCCSPGTWSLLLPLPEGSKRRGSPPAAGSAAAAPVLGVPSVAVSPQATTSSKLTGAGIREGIARTSWLPPSTSGPQLGVCRAVSPVPPGVCLILLLCVSLQKSVCVVVFFVGFFFHLRDFFFFSPPSGCVRAVAWRQASYSSLSFSVPISSLSFIHTTKP